MLTQSITWVAQLRQIKTSSVCICAYEYIYMQQCMVRYDVRAGIHAIRIHLNEIINAVAACARAQRGYALHGLESFNVTLHSFNKSIIYCVYKIYCTNHGEYEIHINMYQLYKLCYGCCSWPQYKRYCFTVTHNLA